jgi:hypothetical protein
VRDGPLAVQGVKRSLNEIARQRFDEAGAIARAKASQRSDDLKEGSPPFVRSGPRSSRAIERRLTISRRSGLEDCRLVAIVTLGVAPEGLPLHAVAGWVQRANGS